MLSIWSGVTAGDVGIALGRPTLTTAESIRIDHWIQGAYLVIRGRLGDLSELDQDELTWVVTEAVAARAQNPDGAEQVDVQVDDGRVSRRYGDASQQIVILPEWWERLSPKKAPRGAFAIRPHYQPG